MTRWTYHSEASFRARHALASYEGRPEDSHEHRWGIAVTVGTDILNNEGFGVDFHAVHRALEAVVKPLHGTDLTDHPDIGSPTPTAENVALYVARAIEPAIDTLGVGLLTVSVWEGPENRVDLDVRHGMRQP